jgi:hypothetical protein
VNVSKFPTVTESEYMLPCNNVSLSGATTMNSRPVAAIAALWRSSILVQATVPSACEL